VRDAGRVKCPERVLTIPLLTIPRRTYVQDPVSDWHRFAG